MFDNDSDHVERLLNELGPAEPPAGFTAGVMARLGQTDSSARGRIVSFKGKGITMIRKVMWGLAAAAMIAFAVFAVKGFPPVGNGTEGTIGAATRYQAPQIADKDVVLGDVSAQQFLQSDTFARLLKDPASMKLLSDPQLVHQLNNPALAAALKNPDLASALRPYGPVCQGSCRVQFFGMLQSASVAKALQDPQVLSALQSQAFAAALKNPQFLAALDDPAVAAALQKQDLQAASMNSALASALKNPELAAALRPYGPVCTRACMVDLNAALQDPSLAKALQNSQVFAALRNPAFAHALSDERLGAALQSQAFQQALTSNGFFAALSDARFAHAIARQ
jgi:sulfur transfer complex TusBCD TusB component (DsrH family)